MLKFLVITCTATAVAIVVGPNGPLGEFWAPSPDAPVPSGGVRGGLIAEGMVENIAFGIGVAILFLGASWFAARTATPMRGRVAWLAAVWLFASWMPHAALHRHIGLHPAGVLPVEWIFHGGAIAAVALLLWSLSLAPGVRSAPRRGREHRAAPATSDTTR